MTNQFLNALHNAAVYKTGILFSRQKKKITMPTRAEILTAKIILTAKLNKSIGNRKSTCLAGAS